MVTRYGFVHISSGDLLRDEVASGSPRGKQLAEIMKKGELVSKDIVLDMIKQAMLKSAGTAKGYLIDGYPREIDQGKDFESKVHKLTLIIRIYQPSVNHV